MLLPPLPQCLALTTYLVRQRQHVNLVALTRHSLRQTGGGCLHASGYLLVVAARLPHLIKLGGVQVVHLVHHCLDDLLLRHTRGFGFGDELLALTARQVAGQILRQLVVIRIIHPPLQRLALGGLHEPLLSLVPTHKQIRRCLFRTFRRDTRLLTASRRGHARHCRPIRHLGGVRRHNHRRAPAAGCRIPARGRCRQTQLAIEVIPAALVAAVPPHPVVRHATTLLVAVQHLVEHIVVAPRAVARTVGGMCQRLIQLTPEFFLCHLIYRFSSVLLFFVDCRIADISRTILYASSIALLIISTSSSRALEVPPPPPPFVLRNRERL